MLSLLAHNLCVGGRWYGLTVSAVDPQKPIGPLQPLQLNPRSSPLIDRKTPSADRST